jgi:hypothetical protein
VGIGWAGGERKLEMEERHFEKVKYIFNEAERRELGEALARENQTVIDLKEEKKAKVAEFAALIEAANKRALDLVTRIISGYEEREVEVLVLLETPRPGLKRVIRVDTNETLFDLPMTISEMQSSFGFTDKPDERAEPGK